GGASSCTCVTGYKGTAGACTAVCGDGLILGSEACDDGNVVSGDSCSASCVIEAHASCTGEPSVCTCNADYYTPSAGNACSRLCTSVSTCNGNGTCSSAGTCQCARGVLGANCETAIVALASESVEITDVTVAVAVSVGSSASLSLPAGALASFGATTITADVFSSASLPAALTPDPAGQFQPAGTFIDLQPHGLTFDVPVDLALAYTG
ncbi:hypothetical protein T484DRAFT_1832719, partial [Baffinella frigidus]